MAPVDTPATVLSTIPYSETSKIARLATRDLGVVSAIAKGARRPKSRFGASLELLSEGMATLIPARQSDLHTLAAFEVTRVHTALGANMDRFAVASALSELMLRCAEEQSGPEIYAFFRHSLDVLEVAPANAVGIVGLRTIWGLVRQLGFSPSLDRCVRDANLVANGQAAAFSIELGGVLCPPCSRGVEATQLAARDRLDLAALVTGEDDLPVLAPRYFAAHRRLLERYVRHHVAEGAALPALGFWAGQRWIAAAT